MFVLHRKCNCYMHACTIGVISGSGGKFYTFSWSHVKAFFRGRLFDSTFDRSMGWKLRLEEEVCNGRRYVEENDRWKG